MRECTLSVHAVASWPRWATRLREAWVGGAGEEARALAERGEFSWRDRVRSFGHASVGVLILFRGQHNAWIHLLVTLGVVALGLYFDVSRLEWCALALAITVVWCAEGLNTALELLADAAVPTRHPLIAKAKDVAAGAVLLAAIGAAVVGVLVLWPYVRSLGPSE